MNSHLEDWLWEWVPRIVLTIMATAFVIILFVGISSMVQRGEETEEWIRQSGYNKADVKAFLRATEFSIYDLRDSKAAFMQFEKFLDGDEMDSQFKKKKTDTMVVPIVVH